METSDDNNGSDVDIGLVRVSTTLINEDWDTDAISTMEIRD